MGPSTKRVDCAGVVDTPGAEGGEMPATIVGRPPRVGGDGSTSLIRMLDSIAPSTNRFD